MVDDHEVAEQHVLAGELDHAGADAEDEVADPAAQVEAAVQLGADARHRVGAPAEVRGDVRTLDRPAEAQARTRGLDALGGERVARRRRLLGGRLGRGSRLRRGLDRRCGLVGLSAREDRGEEDG
ncbi:hypothetical protein OV079_18950 [Nannocystis pusilla]|uniref:Uncharacterized protein n=1 Tax=Nannocystis pusilla TaxID=889268 RepID=A0A9X3IYH4_9BACT|nr:hypothetical protein [Nannocystis pusilla]MCY1007589.1 hypothetical protein [Nannocystis pusilla]